MTLCFEHNTCQEQEGRNWFCNKRIGYCDRCWVCQFDDGSLNCPSYSFCSESLSSSSQDDDCPNKLEYCNLEHKVCDRCDCRFQKSTCPSDCYCQTSAECQQTEDDFYGNDFYCGYLDTTSSFVPSGLGVCRQCGDCVPEGLVDNNNKNETSCFDVCPDQFQCVAHGDCQALEDEFCNTNYKCATCNDLFPYYAGPIDGILPANKCCGVKMYDEGAFESGEMPGRADIELWLGLCGDGDDNVQWDDVNVYVMKGDHANDGSLPQDFMTNGTICERNQYHGYRFICKHGVPTCTSGTITIGLIVGGRDGGDNRTTTPEDAIFFDDERFPASIRIAFKDCVATSMNHVALVGIAAAAIGLVLLFCLCYFKRYYNKWCSCRDRHSNLQEQTPTVCY